MATTDLFISYAREDRETAQALAGVLADDGHAVWWDRDLGGGADFSLEIERRLQAARLVLVLWSQASVQSGFVRDESSRARDARKLLPLRIEAGVALPLGFGNLHTLELLDWDGDADDEACVALRGEVRRQLQRPPAALSEAAQRRGVTLRRWRRPALAATAFGALAVAAAWWFVGGSQGDEREAQAQLERGLAAHFDSEPNLEVARNAYLAALRARADFAPAHFYLAHVYALLQLPADARRHFETALANEGALDAPQRQDARRQLQAIVALLAAPEPVRRELPSPAPTGEPVAAAVVAVAPAAPATAPSAAAGTGSGAEPGASSTLVRVAASESRQRLAQREADALLGHDRQAQLTAATALALDASLAGDALPDVLARTLETLRTQPASAAAREAVAQSLRLLQHASPSLLRENARAAQRVAAAGTQFGGTSAVAAGELQQRLAKAELLKPFVFVQIGDERQRALARSVVARLAAMGYGAPGIENVGAARMPARTEVRVQGTSDPALARWIAQHLGKVVGAEVPLRALRQAQARTDTYEIWFEKDLCVASTRRVAACDPA